MHKHSGWATAALAVLAVVTDLAGGPAPIEQMPQEPPETISEVESMAPHTVLAPDTALLNIGSHLLQPDAETVDNLDHIKETFDRIDESPGEEQIDESPGEKQ